MNPYGIRLKLLKHQGQRLERELIPDRFGEPVLIERYYDEGSKHLNEVLTIYKNKNEGFQAILRLDDPDLWGYQQGWYRTIGIDANASKINSLSKFAGPLSKIISNPTFKKNL